MLRQLPWLRHLYVGNLVESQWVAIPQAASWIAYLQYPPRVVLVVCNTAVTLPPVDEARVQTRVVHGRVAGVELAAVDESIYVGGIAPVVFFCLVLTSPAEQEPYTKHDRGKG